MPTNIPKLSARFETTPVANIASGTTSFSLATATDIYGNALSGLYGFSIDEGQSTQEFFIGTVSGTTISSIQAMTSGSDPLSSMATGLQQTHRKSAVVKITDYPLLAYLREILNGNSNYTIDNVLAYTTHPTFNSNTQLVDKLYADTLSFNGVADASTTNKGIALLSYPAGYVLGNPTISIASPAVVTLASHGLAANEEVTFSTTGALPTGITAATTYYVISAGLTTNTFEISATQGGSAVNTTGTQSGTHTVNRTTPIAVGNSDTRIPTQNQANALVGDNTSIAVGSGNKYVTQTGLQNRTETYASSTGSANAYVLTLSPVPTALVPGQEFEFKANFANTGAATLNINSLGAIAIKKLDGATALVSGDIANGQTVKVKYDGTNFQMLNPVANPAVTYKNLTAFHDTSTASGNQTIAHGLGVTPKYIRISATWASGTTFLAAFSNGSYNGSTMANSTIGIPGGSVLTANNDNTNIILLYQGSGISSQATATFDATNITLAWTKTGSPTGNANLFIEAFA